MSRDERRRPAAPPIHAASLRVLLLLALLPRTFADLYPYGLENDDQELEWSSKLSWHAFALPHAITFFGRSHSNVLVSPSGLVVFDETPPLLDDVHLASLLDLSTLNRSSVAVFLTEEPSVSGHLFMRVSTRDGVLLRDVSERIRRAFNSATNFEPIQLVLLTWADVRNTDAEDSPANTFQLMLATNETGTSFALFHYAQLNWGADAVQGFALGDGRLIYLNDYSSTSKILTLTSASNGYGDNGDHGWAISGQTLEWPKTPDEYYDVDEALTQDVAAGNGVVAGAAESDDCPSDPYRDQCPVDCQLLTDSRGCTLCVCAGMPDPPHPFEEDNRVGAAAVDDDDDDTADGYRTTEPTVLTPGVVVAHRTTTSVTATSPTTQTPVSSSTFDDLTSGSDGEDVTPTARIPTLTTTTRGEREQCTVMPSGEQRSCSENGRCDSSRCCECLDGFYGNGYECLPTDEPQRISGVFEATLNGQPTVKSEIHTFASVRDGGVFTAVSKLPVWLASSLRLLLPVGSSHAWLFAQVADPMAWNGFAATGGRFTRTAFIRSAPSTDGRTLIDVRVEQRVAGRDLHDYLRANINITGALLQLSPTTAVHWEDYNETFTRVDTGVVRSSSSGTVRLTDDSGGRGGGERRLNVGVEQTIEFEECPYREQWGSRRDASIVLTYARLGSTFDPHESVVRWATRALAYSQRSSPTATAGRARQHAAQPSYSPPSRESGAQSGVCADGEHLCVHPHMRCRPVAPSYRCECEHGYQAVHKPETPLGWLCADLDECARGDHTCSKNATCRNTDGSFECHCRPGFNGDGRICISAEDDSGGTLAAAAAAAGRGGGNCDSHAACHRYGECVRGADVGTGICRCRTPYQGDGVHHCGPSPAVAPTAENTAATSSPRHGGSNGLHSVVCRAHNECGEHAECVYSQEAGFYRCECTPPYVGDGSSCAASVEQSGCDVAHDCAPEADCVFDRANDGSARWRCVCRSGYAGDGRRCAPATLISVATDGCDVLKNCLPTARCARLPTGYRCECPPGTQGDGVRTCVPLASAVAPSDQLSCTEQSQCAENAHCVQRGMDSTFVCECLPGHRGHPKRQCLPADECTPADPDACPTHAACVFIDGAYSCRCVEGFVGDGRTQCTAVAASNSRVGCDVNPGLCHANAQCIQDDQARWVCSCKPGSRGDPYMNCTPFVQSRCATPCSEHATCIQQECVCDAGYMGNGLVCVLPSRSCLTERSLCSEHADCVPGRHGHYVCNCNYGFSGDGITCTPSELSPTAGGSGVGRLFVARGMAIIDRLTRETALGKQLVVVPQQTAVGIDVDCERGRLFWSDVSERKIRSAWLNGTLVSEDEQTVAGDGAGGGWTPEGVALDASSQLLYYADSERRELGVRSVDGRALRKSLLTGLANPRAVALHVPSRQLFYADWNRRSPRIGRVSMDGSNHTLVVTSRLLLPNALVVLPLRGELCWVDAGLHELSCVSLTGPPDTGAAAAATTHRRTVLTSLGYPFGLTHLDEQRFYWTDWNDGRIHSVGVTGSGYTSFPLTMGASAGRSYGLVALPAVCHKEPTECGTEDRAGCAYLCLPAPDGPRCVCPDNKTGLKGC